MTVAEMNMMTLKEKYTEKLQLLAVKLLSLDSDNQPQVPSHTDAANLEKIGFFPRDFGMGEWDWPQGVGLYGLQKVKGLLHEDVDQFIANWFQDQLDLGLPLQNINTITPLLALHT